MPGVSKPIIQTFGFQIPSLLFGVISGVFLTRQLGPEGKGVFALFQTNIQLLHLFMGISLNQGLVYFTSNRRISKEKLVGIALIVFFISSLVTALVLFTDFPKKELIIPAKYNTLFFQLYLFCSFQIVLLNSFFAAIFHGEKNFWIVNKIGLFNSILNLVFFGAVYFISMKYKLHAGIREVLLISLLIFFLNLGYYLFAYIRLLKIIPDFLHLHWKEDIKPFFKYVIIGHFGTMINFFNYRLDVWFVTYYSGVTVLGFYSLAVNFAQLLLMITNPINIVLFPYMSGEDHEKSLKMLQFYSRINFTLIFLMVIFFMLTSNFLIPLIYGTAFIQSVVPFRIMLIAIFFLAIGLPFSVFVASTGKNIVITLTNLVGLIIAVILYSTMIPRFGIVGAAVSSGIVYFSIFFILLLYLRRKYKLSLMKSILISGADIIEVKSIVRKFVQSVRKK